MTEAFRLAQLRVWRTIAAPEDDADLADLKAAAANAGRRLVELRGTGPVNLALGWLEEGPLTPDDVGGPGGAGEATVVVLAACLTCCWPDPDAPIFPGVPTTFEELRRILAPLGIQNVTQAVNRLCRWGYLAPDLFDGAIRLGPVVATWPEADVDRLRRRYSQLPAVEGRTGD
ncbi:hypothetical protein ACFYOT_40070 [Saccharothrix saharensis]|uniref:hypothetical protein n=1 Tax=Saccharothrix saharensis TaxID=571190 RepID=UPI0036D1231A